MDDLSAFVDESGSIKKGVLKHKDFFVIALIFTDNERFLNNIEYPICEGDISVRYLDSKNRNLIQLADFIANTFYRAYKKKNLDAMENAKLLKDVLCNGRIFYFPLPHTKEITGHIM